MIRDPSDGSVREKPALAETPTGTTASAVVTKATIAIPDEPLIEVGISGLQTGSTKPENLARLEKSKTWLRDYRAGKINPKDEGE